MPHRLCGFLRNGGGSGVESLASQCGGAVAMAEVLAAIYKSLRGAGNCVSAGRYPPSVLLEQVLLRDVLALAND